MYENNRERKFESKSKLEYKKINNQSKNLIVLFHGYGASMEDLLGLADVMTINKTCDWIFPNGSLEISLGMGIMGRGWFPVDMAMLEQAMLTGSHRDFSSEVSAEFNEAIERSDVFFKAIKADYEKIIVGGFSQGAMITSFLSLMNSECIDAYLCLSGTLVGRDKLIKLLEKSKKFPFFQSHGFNDPILGMKEAQAFNDLFSYAGFKGDFVKFQGAHEIPIEVIRKGSDFINNIFC